MGKQGVGLHRGIAYQADARGRSAIGRFGIERTFGEHLDLSTVAFFFGRHVQ